MFHTIFNLCLLWKLGTSHPFNIFSVVRFSQGYLSPVLTELFGGFSASFYQAYREYAGIPGDYDDRRDLYNLYHMLNHLNLFGGGYYHSVAGILARYRK